MRGGDGNGPARWCQRRDRPRQARRNGPDICEHFLLTRSCSWADASPVQTAFAVAIRVFAAVQVLPLVTVLTAPNPACTALKKWPRLTEMPSRTSLLPAHPGQYLPSQVWAPFRSLDRLPRPRHHRRTDQLLITRRTNLRVPPPSETRFRTRLPSVRSMSRRSTTHLKRVER